MIGCGACCFQFLFSFLLKCIFFFILTCCFNLLFHAITFIPANTSTLNQRWNNIDPQRSSTLFQRWYLVENESWADVHLSTLFQGWQNNIGTTLTELGRFNVDEPKLFQHWNLVENESWTGACLATLFQRWQNNVETALIELRWFNVVSTLILGWKGKLSQRNFIGVQKTALKQLCQYLLYWDSLGSASIIKQN